METPISEAPLLHPRAAAQPIKGAQLPAKAAIHTPRQAEAEAPAPVLTRLPAVVHPLRVGRRLEAAEVRVQAPEVAGAQVAAADKRNNQDCLMQAGDRLQGAVFSHTHLIQIR